MVLLFYVCQISDVLVTRVVKNLIVFQTPVKGDFQIVGKKMENVFIKKEKNLDQDYDDKMQIKSMNMKSNIKSECPQCSAEVLDLKQHIRRIHSQKPKVNLELFCKDCGKRCPNQNQLTLHWSYVHKRVFTVTFVKSLVQTWPN